MYQGYKTQISTRQLQQQLDMLEELEARQLAADAVGVNGEYLINITSEMDSRLRRAFDLIDHFEQEQDCDECLQFTQDLRAGG